MPFLGLGCVHRFSGCKGVYFSRAGDEQCSLFGTHMSVCVVFFDIWFLNVFGIVFCVWELGSVMLCPVFGSGVACMIIMHDHNTLSLYMMIIYGRCI